MKNHRITIIGGGSTTFVPPLIDLLIKSKSLGESTVILMDMNPQRLELMHDVCNRFVEQKASSLTIESTTDRRAALTGADFVLISIASGGFDTYEHDLEIPARYGIFTFGGETVGPGGLTTPIQIPAS
jgi:alpha-galactosidase